jgi:ABC-2 type transport system permease protein
MNTLTICRKELTSYFRSPIGYAVMFIFALIYGYFFAVATASFVQRSVQSTMMGQSIPMNVNEWVISNVISNVNVINIFMIPIITMRLFAEEKRSGTFELLATSPIRDFEMIFGKWLGAMILYTVGLALSLLNVSTLFAYGNPDWRPMMVGFLGLLLQGGSLLAIGTFISACTKNQIIAAVATFGMCLMLYVLDWVSSFEASPVLSALSYLSVSSHFSSFGRGVIDSKDLVYYLSMILLGLFLTARSLESIRWRA